MEYQFHSPGFLPTPPRVAELDRIGEQIAELSAHLEAATARLLDLIRDFDARGGWNGGYRSCAHWLSWRVGLDLGAARERVRVARALGTLPLLARALARGELSYANVGWAIDVLHPLANRLAERDDRLPDDAPREGTRDGEARSWGSAWPATRDQTW